MYSLWTSRPIYRSKDIDSDGEFMLHSLCERLGRGFLGQELHIPIRDFPLWVGSQIRYPPGDQITPRVCTRIFCEYFPVRQPVDPGTPAPNVPPASDQLQGNTRHAPAQLHSNNPACSCQDKSEASERRRTPPLKFANVTQWVKVPSGQSLANRPVVKSTCKPGNGSTELDGARIQAAL